eukprot:UN07283
MTVLYFPFRHQKFLHNVYDPISKLCICYFECIFLNNWKNWLAGF